MKFTPKTRIVYWMHVITNLLLVSFLVLIHIRLYHYAFDDAYIHFRVARNLFETGYPYYNDSDILKVSTSTGWILFLTILYGLANLFKLNIYFPLLVSIANALIVIGGIYIYTKNMELLLKKQLSTYEKLLFQIPFLALLLPSSIGLMETPLALFIAGLGLFFLLHSKLSGFALLGLASYIRMELLILLALVCLFFIFQKQSRPQRIFWYSLLGTFPFIIFDLYFFRTVIPQSIIAKSEIYSIIYFDTFTQLVNSMPEISNSYNRLLSSISITTFMTLIIMTGWIAFREKKNINNYWPILFCLLSLGIICVYTFGHALIFSWYKPLYMVPILVACFVCAVLIEYPRQIIIRIPLFGLNLLSTIFILRVFYAGVFNTSTFFLFDSGSPVMTYLDVGKILYEEYPDANLLTSEIGGLGYSFKGIIFDAAGLASSEALTFQSLLDVGQEAHGEIPPDYVKSTMPDIIVSYDFFAQALINDEIIQQYNAIEVPVYYSKNTHYTEDKTIWGSKFLRIYIYKSLPLSERLYTIGW